MLRAMACLLLLVAVPLSAAEPIVLTDVADGVYVLRVSGSQVSLTAARWVSSPGPVTPPVVPPITPPVVPVNDFAKQVAAAVNAMPATDARHAGAMKLAAVYRLMADQAIPAAKTAEAVKQLSTLALGGDATAWSGTMGVVNAALASCTTEVAADSVLKQAADVIGSTVPASAPGDDEKATAEKYGFDWDKFMGFLMQLLQVLLPIILKI